MATATAPPSHGLERVTAALAHSGFMLGFPCVVPLATWGIAVISRRAPYLAQQSLQALAFQAGVTAALIALALVACLFGLFDLIGYLVVEFFRLIGTIILGAFAGAAMMVGEFRPMAEVERIARHAPLPANWPILAVLGALALVLALWSTVYSAIAIIKSLMGRPFHYPLLGRLPGPHQETP